MCLISQDPGLRRDDEEEINQSFPNRFSGYWLTADNGV